MLIQVISEQNEESNKVVPILQENEENIKWLRRYERNMCPADLYDDINYGQEDLVAPI